MTSMCDHLLCILVDLDLYYVYTLISCTSNVLM